MSEKSHSSASLSTVQGEPFPGQVLCVCGLGKKKLIRIQTNICIFQSGASTPHQILQSLSKQRILTGFEPPRHTRIYTRREMSMLLHPAYTYFSLSPAHTLTHTQGLGTSRLVALTHFLCFEAASGEMAFPIIAFEACVRRRLCVCT